MLFWIHRDTNLEIKQQSCSVEAAKDALDLTQRNQKPQIQTSTCTMTVSKYSLWKDVIQVCFSVINITTTIISCMLSQISEPCWQLGSVNSQFVLNLHIARATMWDILEWLQQEPGILKCSETMDFRIEPTSEFCLKQVSGKLAQKFSKLINVEMMQDDCDKPDVCTVQLRIMQAKKV